MPKVRNVAAEPRVIPAVGVVVGVDEVFDVPQDVFDAHAWPDAIYEIVDAGDGTTDEEVE